MKRAYFGGHTACIGVLAAAALLLLSGVAAATTITPDGDLSDWGVNLQLEYTSSDSNVTVQGVRPTRFVAASFTSSLSDVQADVSNDDMAANEGGELCDVEAIYGTFDATYAYFAVVTTSDPAGTRWDGYGNRRFGPGDLRLVAFDGSSSTTYGVGARPKDLTEYGEIDEVNGSEDEREYITWDSYSFDGTSYTTSAARVESGASWHHVDNPNEDWDAYFKGGSGTLEASVDAAWKRQTLDIVDGAGNVIGSTIYGDYYEHSSYDKDDPYGTWIYEVAIPRSVLGLDNPNSLMDISMFALDCGNDALAIEEMTFGPPVPEPVAFVFFGTGLVGVFGYLSRRRMAKQMSS